jgi:hypothetical protein
MKNNNIKIIAFFLFFGLIGCVENKIKTVDMGNYKIEIPTVWKKISLKGIDSEEQIIITLKLLLSSIEFEFENHELAFRAVIELTRARPLNYFFKNKNGRP